MIRHTGDPIRGMWDDEIPMVDVHKTPRVCAILQKVYVGFYPTINSNFQLIFMSPPPRLRTSLGKGGSQTIVATGIGQQSLCSKDRQWCFQHVQVHSQDGRISTHRTQHPRIKARAWNMVVPRVQEETIECKLLRQARKRSLRDMQILLSILEVDVSTARIVIVVTSEANTAWRGSLCLYRA